MLNPDGVICKALAAIPLAVIAVGCETQAAAPNSSNS